MDLDLIGLGLDGFDLDSNLNRHTLACVIVKPLHTCQIEYPQLVSSGLFLRPARRSVFRLGRASSSTGRYCLPTPSSSLSWLQIGRSKPGVYLQPKQKHDKKFARLTNTAAEVE